MKFVDLGMGQRFELEGEIYSRTGPLVASHAESGKQRFMARYMTVKPLGEQEASVPDNVCMLSSNKVSKAFENHHALCLGLLQQLDGDLPPGRTGAIRQQLEQARQTFLDTLNTEKA